MVSETMERAQGGVKKVLILVVVEDGLGELFGFSVSSKQYEVLILVVVEDGLGVNANVNLVDSFGDVLILVVVEDGLGDCYKRHVFDGNVWS